MSYTRAWPEGWKNNEAGGTYIDAEHLNHMEDGIAANDEAITEHAGASDNPHGVTKTQVGLSNVPNVSTNNQTPTYTVASTLSALTSGEVLSAAFGKIAKGIATLITHVGDTSIHKTTDSALNASSENPVQNKVVYAATKGVLYDGAGAHNAIFRGKNLGTSVTAAQYAAIAAGTFDDMYVGDYWVIGGVNWRIAAFDYYLTTGDTACNTHHVVIVPDTSLYSATMNDSHVTTGGYVGSKMYTENIATAKTTINTHFSGHVMSHRLFLCNAVTNGRPSGAAWSDETVVLMTECNVYGTRFFGVANDGTNIPYIYDVDKSQFPLFRHRPDLQTNRQTFWLRDVVSAANFAIADYYGFANCYYAGVSVGVRPAFCLS